MKKTLMTSSLVCTTLFLASLASAHTPMFSCFDNGDGTIACEGAFSDGSSAAGVFIEVKDAQGVSLAKKKMDETGTVVFDKPKEPSYRVVFDGGPGHTLEIKGKNIQR